LTPNKRSQPPRRGEQPIDESHVGIQLRPTTAGIGIRQPYRYAFPEVSPRHLFDDLPSREANGLPRDPKGRQNWTGKRRIGAKQVLQRSEWHVRTERVPPCAQVGSQADVDKAIASVEKKEGGKLVSQGWPPINRSINWRQQAFSGEASLVPMNAPMKLHRRQFPPFMLERKMQLRQAGAIDMITWSFVAKLANNLHRIHKLVRGYQQVDVARETSTCFPVDRLAEQWPLERRRPDASCREHIHDAIGNKLKECTMPARGLKCVLHSRGEVIARSSLCQVDNPRA